MRFFIKIKTSFFKFYFQDFLEIFIISSCKISKFSKNDETSYFNGNDQTLARKLFNNFMKKKEKKIEASK